MVSQTDLATARKQEYGETHTVTESAPAAIPPGFERSSFPQSLPNGAAAVYREDTPTDSLQIRVYSDKVTIQRDRFNPEYHALRHAAFDATAQTAVGLAVLGAVLSGGS